MVPKMLSAFLVAFVVSFALAQEGQSEVNVHPNTDVQLPFVRKIYSLEASPAYRWIDVPQECRV